MNDNTACENTDRELWRGPDEGGGDFYADSIHITKEGALAINCGGSVYVKPIREWHRLAGGQISGVAQCALREALEFYADGRRYNGANQRRLLDDKYTAANAAYMKDVTRDGGDLARRALATLTSTECGEGK